MTNESWMCKSFKDFTWGDVMDAFNDGFCCICEDGEVACVTNAKEFTGIMGQREETTNGR